MSTSPDDEESPWQPRTVRGETLWLTADGTHVLLPLAMFERYLGRSLAEAIDPPASAAFDAGPELGMMLRRQALADDPTEEADIGAAPTLVATEGTENIDLSDSGFMFDNDPTMAAIRPRPQPPAAARPGWFIGALVGGSLVLLALAAGVWIGSDLRAPAPTAPVVAPAPAAAPPAAPEVVPEPKAEAKVEAKASPRAEPKATPPVASPAPEPRPAPKAEPSRTTVEFKPDAPAPSSWRSNIDRGWQLVEKRPAEAAEAFLSALRQQSNDPDANYGYGYALLKLGEKERARPYLCKARAGDEVTRREVAGLLKSNGLGCE